MNRDEFMAFFRDNESLNTLSNDDRVEIFMSILPGGSDVKALVPQLLADYDVANDEKPYIAPEFPNRFFELLDVDEVKEMITKCAKDEVCIILPHYSINVQMWYNNQENCDPEQCMYDLEYFEEAIGYKVMVNSFDDLIVDVHGIMN